MKRCPQCNLEVDETYEYCRVDGAKLVAEPVATGSEAGTARLGSSADASEAHTSILQHTTNASIDRPTAPTTVLPPTQTDATTRDLTKPKRRGLLIALAIVIPAATALVIGGYFFYGRNRSSPIESIAVLPFQNRSADADSEYLSDGLAESLIYRLSQLPNLKVSPTSSVLRYKGKEVDVQKFAAELGVDAVMTGRLNQRGDNLAISVELIDVRNNKVLWGEQYDRKMSDLLATQREIATAITQKLELKLAGDEAKGITKKYTDSNDAYQLYLRGRHSFAKRTKPDMLAAIEYFRQAVKLDPRFALAHARISEAYGSMPAYPYLSPKEAFPEAKAAARRALEIDPTLAEAHTFLAYSLAIYDWNWADAEPAFKRAIELDPNNVSAHFRYGQIYMATGRLDEGLAEIKRGYDAEPLDMNMAGTVAWAYLITGQEEKALELARKNYELEPNHPIAQWNMIDVYVANGKYTEAISVAERWLQADPVNQFALRGAGIAYAKDGRRDKADEMIKRLRELSKTQYVPNARYAAIFVALGDKDKAFEALNTAFEDRDWELFRFKVDHYWISLHDDPRFAALVKRLNLPK